jgi:adenylate cyclase
MATGAAAAVYQFDRFVLDLGRGVLSADGCECPLRSKSFALLRLLVENAGRLIDRDEIMQAVWPGVFVTDDSIAQCISEIRRVLEDHQQRLLRTLPRRGYLFVAATQRASDPVDVAPPPPEPSLPALPDKPSIAVLPFENMSGDPKQEYFADGMVEEIITALSHIRWLFVIARNSSFVYKGRSVDVRQVGRELGVRYVLEGSVRKGGSHVRITGQLIDAATGVHIWADHFDGPLEDVFDLQDRVALNVAGIIEPALQAAELRRSADRPATDLGAYDFYLRAHAAFYPITKERVLEALGLLDQAIAIDPRYGPALTWAAVCHLQLVTDGWAEAPAENRRKAVDFARRALQVGGSDPGILAHAAFVLARCGEDIAAMIGLVERALALNPSFAGGWFRSGLLRLFAGQPELAIEHIEKSQRLSPHERIGVPLFVMGTGYFFMHRFDEAASRLLMSIQDHPGFPASYRALAACYAHMGRIEEARAIVGELRAITPLVVPGELPFRNPDHRELYLSGLRLAMGEPVSSTPSATSTTCGRRRASRVE